MKIKELMEKINWATSEDKSPTAWMSKQLERPEENKIVWANIEDLFNKTEKDQALDPRSQTGGPNVIGDRIQKNIEYLKQGNPIDPPDINIVDNQIVFGDGRHRLVAAYKLGERFAPILVPNDKVDKLKTLVDTK